MIFRTDLSRSLILLTFLGLAPAAFSQSANFAFSLVDSAGNTTLLASGGSITFPATSTGSVSSVTVVIQNQGSSPGVVNGVSITAGAFQLAGGLLPGTSVPSGTSVRFGINFIPTQLGPVQASLQVTSGTGSAVFLLSGTGVGAAFTYQVQQGSTVTTISPSQAVSFPSTSIGRTSVSTIQVNNTGSGSAQISAIAISGAGFQLASLPILPVTAPSGGSIGFQVIFAPTQPSQAAGRLQVGNDFFNLSGTVPTSASFTFGLIDSSGNSTPLSPGGTITFPATSTSGGSSVTVALTNQSGNDPAVVTGISVTGAGFQISGAPFPGTTVAGGSTLSFTVKFTPAQLGPVQGSLQINLGGAGSFKFPLAGTGQGPAYAYQVQQGSNITSVIPSQAIAFPNTQVGQTSIVTIQVSNTGNASGQIASIAILGAGYQLANLPFLPVTVVAGGSISFQVVFAPTQPSQATGRLQVGSDTFNLSGTALGAALVYSFTTAGTTVQVQNSGTVGFSPTSIGATASANFSISNQGTAVAVITSIGVGGSNAVFSLSNLPPLPLTLAPGASAAFTVTFTPNSVGVVTASLIIDAQSITLTGPGTASAVVFSYTSAGKQVTVQINGTVAFSPTTIGALDTTNFSISNQGETPVAINSISAAGSSAAFSLSGLPSLPFTLTPAGSLTLTIRFAPTSVGVSTAALLIDAQSFTLSGFGAAPPPLPGYTFSGAGGPQDPLTQPGLGLSLNAPYPLPLTGTLTLSFVSDVFADDPAIQFSTGSRTVSFTIPANTTSAVFSNGSAQIRFSTGSVAGTITATPTFATVGGNNVTPDSPLALSMTVAQSAPVLLNAQVDSTSASGLTVSLTGMATGRNLTQIGIHFTLTPAAALTVPDTNLNVEQAFSAWYQGSASQPFGSAFTVSLPFSLAGQIQGVASLVNSIQSVTVTLTNRQGVSNSMTSALAAR